ncbi:MAG: hypothetical protein ACO3MF_03440 [Acholeplasmataceae bacterium]
MKIFLQATQEPKTSTLTIDVSHIEDMIHIKPFELTYEIIARSSYYDLIFDADIDLTLACAKTLKPVPYQMHLHATISFGNLDEADFEITKEIELDQLVLGEIMAEKPVLVYHHDANNIKFEKEKNPSPFEALLED